MSDDETPFTPGLDAEPEVGREEEREAPGENPTGGKLIRADVFLSRLAERQRAERDVAMGSELAIETILGALEDIGLDPDTLAPDFAEATSSGALEEDWTSGTDSTSPSLEDMALEELFLSELRAGRRPSLSVYMRRYSAQRDALLRLAARMDPHELAGLEAPEAMAPEQEAALRAGQEEGTRKALEALTHGSRRGRGATRRVAEEQAPYAPDTTDGKAKGKRGRGHSRPAQPKQSEPDR